MLTRKRVSVLVVALLATAVVGGTSGAVVGAQDAPVGAAAGVWADSHRSVRLPVALAAGTTPRKPTVVDVPVDFAAALAAVGVGGTFDPRSVRLVEVDSNGAVIDSSVASQFDQRPGAAAGDGTLVIQVERQTASGATRRYHAYFDVVAANVPPVAVAPQVVVSTAVDEGQTSYVFQTPSATWFYHRAGGGFSSLVDPAGSDWLNYSTAPRATGEFRGIPNAVHPDGHFHPGATTSVTTILSQGPLKVEFESVVGNRQWVARWSMYPDRAHMRMVNAPGAYWWLYEGTPGGQIDSGDVVVRPSGTPTPLMREWTGDLTPEYAGFVDPARNRSLVAIHHENDTNVDSHRVMDGAMTVFGFGRNGVAKTLTGRHSFTVALLATDAIAAVRAGAKALLAPWATSTGTPERRAGG